jgi:predicted SAM-dependent methyltransferase
VPQNSGEGAQGRILDVGCGINKYPGAVGIDRIEGTAADVIVDVDHFPYPFRDAMFDHVRAVHVIEHVADVIRTIEEFHRLLRPGGTVYIATPHYTDYSSFCDPTHRTASRCGTSAPTMRGLATTPARDFVRNAFTSGYCPYGGISDSRRW